MSINSWSLLESDDQNFRLSDVLKNKDPFNGVDIGWVSQMRPLIKEFSNEGELVLDPFGGLGTTLVAAAAEKRKTIGIELESERVALIQKRFIELEMNTNETVIHNGDCVGVLSNLINSSQTPEVSLCISSVPYFNSEWKGSKIAGQLYAQSNYNSYLNYFRELCYLLRRVVKPEGYIILIAENIRTEKEVLLPIAWDIASVMMNFFTVYDERVIAYNKSFELSGDPELHTNRSHEYVLIAQNKIPSITKEDCLVFLQKLAQNFDFILYGGFRDFIHNVKSSTNDIDLIFENTMKVKSALHLYLSRMGFDIFSEEMQLVTEQSGLNACRFIRCCKKTVKQVDIIFLDRTEMKKITTKGDPVEMAESFFEICENWTVNL